MAAASAALAWWVAPALAAPEAAMWERWTAHSPDAQRTIDHAAWDAFLGRTVRVDADGLNRVAYGDVTASDRKALRAYIDRLATTPIRSYARDEQLAYWINLYNALTVDVVLEHYPVESIRDIRISPGLFSSGPWGKKLVDIEGEPVSLDDIEHRILRPIWRDPRIHYAVNCASVGCPNLRREAFTAANTDAALDAAAADYVNSPRGVSFEDGELVVSSIYVWFQEDFGGSDAGVIRHLKRHAAPALRERLAGHTRLDDDQYDWRLNDARRSLAPAP